MPAGAFKKQTPRHDGGKSLVCGICGQVGARVHDVHYGRVHRRCIGPVKKIHFLAPGCARAECGALRGDMIQHSNKERDITCARCIAIRI